MHDCKGQGCLILCAYDTSDETSEMEPFHEGDMLHGGITNACASSSVRARVCGVCVWCECV